MKPTVCLIEPLESRIAPATLVNSRTLTYADIDGDKVTVTTSTGTFVFANPPNGTALADTFVLTAPNAVGGHQLKLVDLRQGSGFQGAELTFSVVEAGSGDGRAAVGLILATGIDLGKVTVKGALGELRVAEDIRDASIVVTADVDAGATIGSVAIGGAYRWRGPEQRPAFCGGKYRRGEDRTRFLSVPRATRRCPSSARFSPWRRCRLPPQSSSTPRPSPTTTSTAIM